MKTLLLCAALCAVLRLCSSDCTTSPRETFIFTGYSQQTKYGITTGTATTAICVPGYVSYYNLSANSFDIYCGSDGNWHFTNTSSGYSAFCVAKPNWCSTSSGVSNQPFVVLPTYSVQASIGSSIYVWCKGRTGNYGGNGTHIIATCVSSNDGSSGVWQSNDYCSGGLSLKSSVLFVLLAATLGVMLRRF